MKTGVDVQKLFVDKENHTYLWHNLEVVEKIASTILKPAFNANITFFYPIKHKLLHIRPTIDQEFIEAKGSEQNETMDKYIHKASPRAKL